MLCIVILTIFARNKKKQNWIQYPVRSNVIPKIDNELHNIYN